MSDQKLLLDRAEKTDATIRIAKRGARGGREHVRHVEFQFCSPLPLTVQMGSQLWRIALEYDGKGRRAALVASCGERHGNFIEGRARIVERRLRDPITVPVGTVRHRLVFELVRTRRAILVNSLDESLDESDS